jgi:hypothetical protein
LTPLPQKPPKKSLFVKLRDGVGVADREVVIDGLRNLVPQQSALIVDTNDLVSSTEVSMNILTFFFNFGKFAY